MRCVRAGGNAACYYYDRLHILKYLVSQKADPFREEHYSNWMLNAAHCGAKKLDVIKYLVEELGVFFCEKCGTSICAIAGKGWQGWSAVRTVQGYIRDVPALRRRIRRRKLRVLCFLAYTRTSHACTHPHIDTPHISDGFHCARCVVPALFLY